MMKVGSLEWGVWQCIEDCLLAGWASIDRLGDDTPSGGVTNLSWKIVLEKEFQL